MNQLPFHLCQSHPSGLLSCDRAKIWTDGGLGAKTAAMLEPYADDKENMGVMQMTQDEIAQVGSRKQKEILQWPMWLVEFLRMR